jgi:hypothetical protein
MGPKFSVLVVALAPKLDRLVAMPPPRYGMLPRDMPASGVYLFTEAGRHLYVGRSNSLRGRHGRHCRPGATHRQADFAFLLAREKTGHKEATYRTQGGRSWLMEQPDFKAAFDEGKARMRAMEYRYVARPLSRNAARADTFDGRGLTRSCHRPDPPRSSLMSANLINSPDIPNFILSI